MNSRLGPSCALSFLIVAVAAVALHRPEPATATPAVATRTEPAKPPDPTPGEAMKEVPGPVEPRVRPVSRRKAVEAPDSRSAFTRVGAGESLADVARRVYGSAEDADRLWRANRDVLDRPGQDLSAGMLLRTP